jgi:ADP-heptose:LPS heptosyltransferase
MKILVIHFGDLESLIYLSKSLKNNMAPEANITVLLSENTPADWIARLKLRCILIKVEGRFLYRRALLKKLRAEKFDVLLDLQRDFYKQAYRLAKALPIAVKVGYNFNRKKKPYTNPIEKKQYPHVYNYYCHGLKTLFPSSEEEAVLDVEKREDFSIFVNLSANFSGRKWKEEFWGNLLLHPTFAPINIAVYADNDCSKELLNRLKKAPNISFVNVADLKSYTLVITLLNNVYLNALDLQKRVLFFDEKTKSRKLRSSIVAGSSTITARYEGETITDIQFDVALKALREIIYEAL